MTANKYIILNLSKPQQWLFGLAMTIGFMAANFSDGILLYFRPFENLTTNLLFITGASRILGTGLLASIYGVITYLGIMDIRKNGVNRKNTITTAIGILSCIGMMLLQIYSFSVTHDFNNYTVTSQDELINGMKDKLQTNLTPDRLSKLSLVYAQTMYEVDGSLNEYRTSDGKLNKYEPNDEARKNRHLFMMLTYIRERESSMKTTVIILWLLAAIAAISVGSYYPTNRSTP
jgi:hypothetical protein